MSALSRCIFRCGADHVWCDVRSPARAGGGGTASRVPPGRLDCDGQLDAGRVCRQNVSTHRQISTASSGRSRTGTLGRRGDSATALLEESIRVSLTRQKVLFDYPFPPDEVVAFFRQYFGPTQMAFKRLDPGGQAALASQLESLWREHNRAGTGRTRVEVEYLDVRAIRS